MIVDVKTVDVFESIKTAMEDALELVGAEAVSLVSDRIRANGSVVSSNLVNSINWATQSIVGTKPTTIPNDDLTAPDDKMTVKVGTNVVYAARVEFGFVGTDSLGRSYNQPPKSYLRSALLENEQKLIDLFHLVADKALQ